MAIANITNNILTDSGVATSSLLTTSAAASTYLALAGGTLTGALGGTSASFSSTTNSSTTANGALVVAGGVGIGGETNIAGTTIFGVSASGNSKFYIYGGFSAGLNLLQNYSGSAYTTEEHRASDYVYKIGTTAALTIASTGAATFSSSVTATSSSFPIDIYGTTNNYGLRINNTGASTLLLYSSNANAASRNWGLFTNYNIFGDFSIVQSNAINGDLTNGANGTSRFYIKNDGNVGIGTSTPANKLFVVASGTATTNGNNSGLFVSHLTTGATTDGVGIGSNGGSSYKWIQTYDGALSLNPAGNNVLIGTTNNATGLLQVNGTIYATGFFESSSIKGKDIIATNPLLALNIDVIKYTRKNDESKDIRYGYSAEQIHSLMPELTDKDVTAVKYLDVHTILISQLQKEIKELKAKMN